METIYHLRVKQEHAFRIIEELIQADAVEDLDRTSGFELNHSQKEAIDVEIAKIAENKNYLLDWNNAKARFEQP